MATPASDLLSRLSAFSGELDGTDAGVRLPERGGPEAITKPEMPVFDGRRAHAQRKLGSLTVLPAEVEDEDIELRTSVGALVDQEAGFVVCPVADDSCRDATWHGADAKPRASVLGPVVHRAVREIHRDRTMAMAPVDRRSRPVPAARPANYDQVMRGAVAFAALTLVMTVGFVLLRALGG